MEDTGQIIVIILSIIVSILGARSKKRKEQEKMKRKTRTMQMPETEVLTETEILTEVEDNPSPWTFMEEGEHSIPTEPLEPETVSAPPVAERAVTVNLFRTMDTAPMKTDEESFPAADIREEFADPDTLKKAVVYREILTPKFQTASEHETFLH